MQKSCSLFVFIIPSLPFIKIEESKRQQKRSAGGHDCVSQRPASYAETRALWLSEMVWVGFEQAVFVPTQAKSELIDKFQNMATFISVQTATELIWS
jgi:hypothetical protein